MLVVRKMEAGELLKCCRFFYTFETNYIDHLHTPSSEPFFYDTAYKVPKRQHVVVPINEKGILFENDLLFSADNKVTGWQCNDKCKMLRAEKKLIDALYKIQEICYRCS